MSKNVDVKQNKNKMPNVLKFSLFLCILGILSGGLLSLVNNVTKKRIEENEIKKEFSEIAEVGVEVDSLLEITDIHQVAIDKMFRATSLDGVPSYVFVVTDTNQFTSVKVIVLIEITTEKILNIKVLPGASTHGYDSQLESSDFGMVGKPLENIDDNFQIVTGATTSSGSVKNCLKVIEKELSLISGKPVFKELKQKLPEIYNFEYTFEVDNKDITLLLKLNESTKNFEYVDSVTGIVKEETIDEYLALANMNFPTNYIKNVYNDATGTILTIVTDKGYKGEMVSEIKIYNNRIISFVLKSSNENYHRNPNYTYDGNVEDYIFEQYSLGIKDTIVTGATITSKAINYMLALAEEYISSLGGVKNG